MVQWSRVLPTAGLAVSALLAGAPGCANGGGGAAVPPEGGCGLTGCAEASVDGGFAVPEGGVPCLSGLACSVPCPPGQPTRVTGKVYDPARQNGLYDVAVYVPAVPLKPLPRGVPTGADACDCSALFQSGAVVSAQTAVDGTFTLENAPVGRDVPLVLQIGKWRKVLHLDVHACVDNAQPDGRLAMPGTLAGGDPDDSMPEIAVSTGGADRLECLMQRMGIPTGEYVGGADGAGHVHVFSGGDPNMGGAWGVAESPGWAENAPTSWTALWDSAAHLMPYDVVLLSCEAGETYQANPPALEQYLNAGGRAFASHYHYAWFAGTHLPGGSNLPYPIPVDWGDNLATWNTIGPAETLSSGSIVQTVNGTARPFPKGQALYAWLAHNGALGIDGALPDHLPIVEPRFNARVSAINAASQPWISDDETGDTLFFSFDTPVGAKPQPDGGAPSYCGRAVYSDLHVAGDNPDPAPDCNPGKLSPQEQALEFMLFDLTSCVTPYHVTPGDGGVTQ